MNRNRFSMLEVSRGIHLKNRVVVPAMASETATSLGGVTSETLTHYLNLAEAGAGLMIAEYSYVHRSGRSEDHQLGIDLDSQTDGLTLLARAMKSKGAIAGIQLTHAAGKSDSILTGRDLMAPSSISVPVKDKNLEVPRSMNDQDIQHWREWFLAAARRAKKAGFDLVELHAAHGYGLNQWLSSITNHRTDQYGGRLENRARLLIEIIREIRHHLPELLISVRMPGQDFMEQGLSNDEAKKLALILESEGVSLLSVSSGIGGWRRPRDRSGEGYLVAEARMIQSAVSVPVIGVGGIETGGYIDELISSKSVSLAAVGRAILNGPKLWGLTHLKEGKNVRTHSSDSKSA